MASPNCRFSYCTDEIHTCGAPTDFGTPTLYIALPIFTIIFLLIGISGCVVCCLPLKRFFDTKWVRLCSFFEYSFTLVSLSSAKTCRNVDCHNGSVYVDIVSFSFTSTVNKDLLRSILNHRT